MPRFLIGTTSVYNHSKEGEGLLIILALHQEISAVNAEQDEDDCLEEAAGKLKNALLRLLTPYLIDLQNEQKATLKAWALEHLNYHLIERTPLVGNNNEEIIEILKVGVKDSYSSVLSAQIIQPKKNRHSWGLDDELGSSDYSCGIHSQRTEGHRTAHHGSTNVKQIVFVSPCNLGYPNEKKYALENPEVIYDIMETFRVGRKKAPLPPTKCIWTAESIAIRDHAKKNFSLYKPGYINPKGLLNKDARLMGINNYFYAPKEIISLMSYLGDWWKNGLKLEDMQINNKNITTRKKPGKAIADAFIPENPALKAGSQGSRRASLMGFVRKLKSNSPEAQTRSRSSSLPTYFADDEKSVATTRTTKSLSDLAHAVFKRLSFTKVIPVDDTTSFDPHDLSATTTITTKRGSTDSRRSSGGSSRRGGSVTPFTKDELDQLMYGAAEAEHTSLWALMGDDDSEDSDTSHERKIPAIDHESDDESDGFSDDASADDNDDHLHP